MRTCGVRLHGAPAVPIIDHAETAGEEVPVALQLPLGPLLFPEGRALSVWVADKRSPRDALSLYTFHSSGRFSIAGTPP